MPILYRIWLSHVNAPIYLRHLDRYLEESVERVGRILPLAAIRQRLALRLPPKRDRARLLDGRHQVRRAVVAECAAPHANLLVCGE